jgi:outer membrane protein W
MKCNTLIGLILGLGMGLSYSLLLSNNLHQQSFSTETNDSIVIDTVDVIEEDGVRWYTIDTTWHIIDTVKYESIDTTVFVYPWGREEIYYFKYKES